ncbi:hypothetical protein GY45DRAFT_643912 [Cubamyces sp. BRFM 1775]|nr:hypothetical protein GY45DRAFT_643912 [Cubamyces sp. BRFM 1775]
MDCTKAPTLNKGLDEQTNSARLRIRSGRWARGALLAGCSPRHRQATVPRCTAKRPSVRQCVMLRRDRQTTYHNKRRRGARTNETRARFGVRGIRSAASGWQVHRDREHELGSPADVPEPEPDLCILPSASKVRWRAFFLIVGHGAHGSCTCHWVDDACNCQRGCGADREDREVGILVWDAA